MRWVAPCLIALALGVSSLAAHEFDRARTEQAALAVLDDFMTAFNAYDVEAWSATLHYPHFRLASGQMRIDEGGPPSVDRLAGAIRRLRSSGWHHSAWDRRHVVHVGPSKVHIDTQFTRYREDASVIATYESLYIVTLEDGRWGVKMRSSFAR